MEPVIADNLSCIEQAIDLLQDIGEEIYTATSTESLGTEVGGHLRHNIDHYALIAMICRLHGVGTSDDFGVAPSTLRYRQLSLSHGCVR